MISSTKPRSHQPRIGHTPPPPSSIIPPTPVDPVPPTPTLPPSLSSSPSKRPSAAATMNWLSRSATSASVPHAAPKPVKISEPKLVRGIDTLAHPRNGALGSGATIVRTPDEALRETGVRINYDSKANETPKPQKPKKQKKASISKTIGSLPLGHDYFAPGSPPLPPLPVPESDEEHMLSRSSSESEYRMSPTKRPPGAVAKPLTLASAAPVASASTLAPVPVPRSPSRRPALKIRSTISSDEVVPPLPSAVPPSPCPPFKPILMSDLPSHPVDETKVIVTLETCTETHKTSLETLRSRPSNLSKYVDSLLVRHRTNSSTSSVYSTTSDDNENLTLYRNHLASQGILPPTHHKIHIFLDRPSAPYAHILTYLRSMPAAPDHPEVIPRAVMYQQSTHARLESLIELRDEAAFLKLDGLHKLCVDEIRKGHAPKLHARGNSSSINSVHSMQASVVTMQTLVERAEGGADPRASSLSLPVPSEGRPQARGERERDNSLSDQSSAPSSRGPPTPHSWETGFPGPGHTRNRSLPTSRSLKSPPVGWI